MISSGGCKEMRWSYYLAKGILPSLLPSGWQRELEVCMLLQGALCVGLGQGGKGSMTSTSSVGRG